MLKLRLFAVFITLITILSIGVFAFNSGDGTSTSPYEIASTQDLEKLAAMSETDSLENVHFIQTSNIEIESVCIAPSKNYPFKGVYDGRGYSISGLATSYGLFAYSDSAKIKNINIKDATINPNSMSAGIVGKAMNSTTISNCTFSGEIADISSNAFTTYIGGICAYTDQTTSITRCSSDITTVLTKSPYIFYLGGIVGNNTGIIEECVSDGSIVVVSDNYIVAVGGITGKNTGEIFGSKNNADVSGTINSGAARLYIAGIAGENEGTISRTENTGNISCIGYEEYPAYAGGITGYNVNGTITVCKNSGKIDAGVSYAGGVLGINLASDGNATVKDTLNTGEVATTDSIAGGIAGNNLAIDKETNTSYIGSSLNLHETTGADAAVGSVSASNDAESTVEDVVVKNSTSEHAETMTNDELISVGNISQLNSSAWLFPKNGFLPQLATVKNLNKTEVLALSINKEENKVAFSVYNSNSPATAYAVISCYVGTRCIGAKFVPVSIPEGHEVFTAEFDKISQADSVNVMLLDSITKLSPIADKSNF